MIPGPRIPQLFVRFVLPPEYANAVLGDLAEAFETDRQQLGRVRATFNYWREAMSVSTWELRSRTRTSEQPQGVRELVGGVLRDVRFGGRSALRTPGLTLTAVVILAVAIGANTTIFAMANTIFMAPAPHVAAPGELVSFTRVTDGRTASSMGYPDYEFFRDNTEALTGLLAYNSSPTVVSVALEHETVPADAWMVSDNFFDVLGSRPAMGRTFSPGEGREQLSAVVSHGFWMRYSGGDASVVGETLRVNGHQIVVVGVMPPDFRGVNPLEIPPDLYVPVETITTLDPGSDDMLARIDGNVSFWLRLIGRLRPGVDIATAQAQLDVLETRWESEFADWIAATGPSQYDLVLSANYRLSPRQTADLNRLLRLLFAVVGTVLLIASANIAILLLARGSARQHEIGVRVALGAGRSRLVRQLLTESVLLAALGGVGGFGLAFVGVNVATSLMPYSFATAFALDGRVLLFSVATTLGTAIVFGLFPAMQLARKDIFTLLGRATEKRSRLAVRHSLVVTQMALSIALASGAGLFVRSLRSAQAVDLGFQSENKALLSVSLTRHGYDDDRGAVFVREVQGRLAAHPAVRGVTTTRMVPFRGMWTTGVNAPGTPFAEQRYDAGANWVGIGYFAAMGIPILAGRDFNNADVGATDAVVINRQLAEEVWVGESPLGKSLGRWTVIGVVENATYYDVGEEPRSQLYMSHQQNHSNNLSFVVHTAGDPAGVLGELRGIIQEYDPDVAVSNIRTLQSVVDAEFASYRALAILLTAFSSIALLLAGGGLYGVQAFLVSKRVREIGIRMALGAVQRQVAVAVIGRGVAMAGLGVVIGVAATIALGGLVQSMLFGVDARDPITLVTVSVGLLVVAAMANVVPAARATRVDPVEALRES